MESDFDVLSPDPRLSHRPPHSSNHHMQATTRPRGEESNRRPAPATTIHSTSASVVRARPPQTNSAPGAKDRGEPVAARWRRPDYCYARSIAAPATTTTAAAGMVATTTRRSQTAGRCGVRVGLARIEGLPTAWPGAAAVKVKWSGPGGALEHMLTGKWARGVTTIQPVAADGTARWDTRDGNRFRVAGVEPAAGGARRRPERGVFFAILCAKGSLRLLEYLLYGSRGAEEKLWSGS